MNKVSKYNTIKALRSLLNLSQKELANKLEVDQSFISKIESGKKKLPGDYLEKIETKLNIPKELIILLESEDKDLKYISSADAKKLAAVFLGILKSYE